MHESDLSTAPTDAFVDLAGWQSQLAFLKERLAPVITNEPGLAAQVQQQLRDCAADLTRLHATLNLQFDRRQQQLARVNTLELKMRRAKKLADIDSLTALPNRRYFLRRLARALANAKTRNRSVAVLFLDIDDFKQINDQYGHATGDKLLRIVAKRLSRCLRSDDVVSRLGGDEFACLLANDASHDNAGKVAAKLLDVVSIPTTIGCQQLAIRPSVGIALHPDDGLTCDELLHHADSAMYHAKQIKAGCAFYDSSSPYPVGATPFEPPGY
jgi:diguanylate cyclase